jgi:HAD superfamily hydrolase (TIGR01549 family)
MTSDNQLINRLRSRSLKGIIFDFDGTLLDIKEAMEKSIEEIFTDNRIEADMDLTIQEIGALLETLQGHPLPKIILQSYDMFKYITAFKDLTFLKKVMISTKIFSKFLEHSKEAPIFPETKVLLETLGKKLKYDLFIVSHSKKEKIVEHLARNGIEKYFKGIYGTDELPSLKPSPDALKPVLNQYSQDKTGEFIMIGDMPTDIEAGQEAGCGTIAIASGISNKEILANLKPDLLIDSLEELSELIGISTISSSNTHKPAKIKS